MPYLEGWVRDQVFRGLDRTSWNPIPLQICPQQSGNPAMAERKNYCTIGRKDDRDADTWGCLSGKTYMVRCPFVLWENGLEVAHSLDRPQIFSQHRPKPTRELMSSYSQYNGGNATPTKDGPESTGRDVTDIEEQTRPGQPATETAAKSVGSGVR